MLVRVILLVLLLLSIGVAEGTFKPSREADFWQNTAMDLPYLRTFINQDNCYNSQDSRWFKACHRAVVRAVSDLAGEKIITREFLAHYYRTKNHPDFDDLLTRLQQEPTLKSQKALWGSMLNDFLGQFDAHAKIEPAEYLDFVFGHGPSERIGIGIETEINGKGLFIRAVANPSPAFQAGLMVNDQILAINGVSVGPLKGALLAMNEFLGESGKSIRLEIQRGSILYTVNTQLAHLIYNNVVSSSLGPISDSTFYAHIGLFREGTCADLENQITDFKGKAGGIKNFILDLRNNTGGLTEQAACVMSLLSGRSEFGPRRILPPQLLQSLPLATNPSPNDSALNTGRASLQAIVPGVHLVIVVNATTASASERIAAALRDYQMATIVGERTSGKGTAQRIADLGYSPTLRLKYTYAEFLRPSGQRIQLVGVTPDILAGFNENAELSEHEFLREADLFPTTISSGGVVHASEDLPSRRPLPTACIHSTKVTSRTAALVQSWKGHRDNQLATALAVLKCE